MPIPAGGAATINGVIYQMLWCLLRTARLNAEACVVEERTGRITSAILRLEPGGGGGDLQELSESRRIIEQLKARPGGGPWSLREVIEGVIPDLYQAVEENAPKTTYRFVTEGRIGSWSDVLRFFETLRHRKCPDGDVLAVLDATEELKFRGRPSPSRKAVARGALGTSGPYTERSLFSWIVQVIRSRRAVQSTEPIEATHKKLWELLGHFEFEGGRTSARLQSEVDSLLLAIVDTNTSLTQIRDALLFDLARRASRGDAEVETSRFLHDHGLDSTPLSQWVKLRETARDLLQRQLSRQGYERLEDVRESRAESVVSGWPENKPILLVTGVSGQGKSWHAAGIARVIAAGQELAILIRSRGNADGNLAHAADVFWQGIKGNDGHRPLARIAALRRELVREQSVQWLTLLIDGIQDVNEARELVQQPWEDWGVRLAVTCDPDLAPTFRREARDRCHSVEVGDFTLPELQDYLGRRLGEDWPGIPTGVRNLLRRPLLARLYCDLAGSEAWRPANEYALFAKYWERLFQDEQAAYRLDVAAFQSLALSLLADVPYPWTGAQVLRAGVDNQAVARLCRVGWLRPLAGGRFEVWHDRLLNWAVAEGLVASVLGGEINASKFCDRLRELASGKRLGGKYLDSVPMDTLWLLSDFGLDDLLSQVIETIEGLPWDLRQSYFKQVFPTLGPPILPILYRRLEASRTRDDRMLTGMIVESITAFDANEVTPEAIRLLATGSPFYQRTAMRILARRPASKALDRLWELHCAIQADPKAYFLDSNDSEHRIYEDSFDSLRECVRLKPSWLEFTISKVDPKIQPVSDLAYLLANVGDPELWRACKRDLFAKVSHSSERSLASNIFRYRDREELPWLLERIHREDDLLGPWALRALGRIDPQAAIRELGRLPSAYVGLTKKWCVEELLVRQPESTRRRILEIAKAHSDPWKVLSAYNGDEEALDCATLEFMLDELEILLDAEKTEPRPSNFLPLYLPLKMLASVHRLELLECFEHRRRTTLELKLTDWLVAKGPRKGPFNDSVEREHGVAVLFKIGGAGFTEVINSQLDADNPFGRHQAFEQALKRPDDGTYERLIRIARQDELWNGHADEQADATWALAALGRWSEVIDSVVRWGEQVSQRPAWLREGQDPLSDEVMRVALEAFAERGQHLPGSLLAIGVGRRSDYADAVFSIAKQAPNGSQVARAAIITLGRLQVDSNEIVEFLTRQVTLPAHREHALIALFRLGGDRVEDALLRLLRDEFDKGVATALLSRSRTRKTAANLVLNHMGKAEPNVKISMIEDLLIEPRDSAIPELLLDESPLREFLLDRAFNDTPGGGLARSWEIAIRGLANLDPKGALFAAQTALRNPATLDRMCLPALLTGVLQTGPRQR